MDLFQLDLHEVKNYVWTMATTIVFTFAVLFLIRVVVGQFFKRTHFIEPKKEETILSVMKNSFNYIAFIIIVIAALKPFVDIQNLLVAGGVLGIVIGFGAQSAIRDLLYGFFFLFEGQFRKGDFVNINNSVDGGVVEELGFRALKLRLLNGKLLTISNGEVLQVVNGNVEKRRIFESIIVSFREDPSRIKVLLEEVCVDLNEKHKDYLMVDKGTEDYEEQYRVYGLSSLDSNPLGFKFSIAATTKDTDYVTAVQEAKEAIAQKLYDEKVRMPEQSVFYQTRAVLK